MIVETYVPIGQNTIRHAQNIIDWCKERGYNIELEGGSNVVPYTHYWDLHCTGQDLILFLTKWAGNLKG